jgi:hypothetical protein
MTDRPPTDDESIAAHNDLWRSRTRPENEVPASVAVDLVLGSNVDVVAYVSGMLVFSTGVELTLDVRARPGHRIDGEALADLLFHRSRGGKPYLFGVEYADGRRSARRHTFAPVPEPDPDAVSLLQTGGSGGGGNSYSLSYFLSPLPPPGEVHFHFLWPDATIPETRSTMSADAILDAASRARVLWPWEDETWGEEDAPEIAHDLPAGSWFA